MTALRCAAASAAASDDPSGRRPGIDATTTIRTRPISADS
jgi:hypothetical protein